MVKDRIAQAHKLEPYFKIGEEIAKTSPCTRRQYGAVVVHNGPAISHSAACNERVGRCCEGSSCARTRFELFHGERVEVGGEIHAETAVLIQTGMRSYPAEYPFNTYFILVGFMSDKELLGKSVRPCHSCALAIKYAGYTHIYIRNEQREIVPISVSQIIEEREAEWEPPE